jgi:hypothetical protein
LLVAFDGLVYERLILGLALATLVGVLEKVGIDEFNILTERFSTEQQNK